MRRVYISQGVGGGSDVAVPGGAERGAGALAGPASAAAAN